MKEPILIKPSNTRRLDQLTQEQLNQLLSTEEGFDRVISLQEKALIDVKGQVDHTFSLIIDKEEAASRWLNILIVLGLLQLFPFSENTDAKIFLILSLPSFIIAFYSVALTFYKHPNHQKTDSFVGEDFDKPTRFNRNQIELNNYQEIFICLHKRYEKKHKTYAFIGPSIIVNFSVCIFYLIYKRILGCDFSSHLVFLIVLASIFFILRIKINGSKESFNITYKKDESGIQTYEKKYS